MRQRHDRRAGRLGIQNPDEASPLSLGLRLGKRRRAPRGKAEGAPATDQEPHRAQQGTRRQRGQV